VTVRWVGTPTPTASPLSAHLHSEPLFLGNRIGRSSTIGFVRARVIRARVIRARPGSTRDSRSGISRPTPITRLACPASIRPVPPRPASLAKALLGSAPACVRPERYPHSQRHRPPPAGITCGHRLSPAAATSVSRTRAARPPPPRPPGTARPGPGTGGRRRRAHRIRGSRIRGSAALHQWSTPPRGEPQPIGYPAAGPIGEGSLGLSPE
jgi:hypothetical protein